MMADDPLGAGRENPAELGPYHAAFARLAADPDQRLLVAEEDGRLVGSLQLAILLGLFRQGSSRALIEAVRVRSDRRGAGLGGRGRGRLRPSTPPGRRRPAPAPRGRRAPG